MNTTKLIYRSAIVALLGLGSLMSGCSNDGQSADGDGATDADGIGALDSDGSDSAEASDLSTAPTLQFIAHFSAQQGKLPEGLILSPDGAAAYVSFAFTGRVARISLADGTLSNFGRVDLPDPVNGQPQAGVLGMASDRGGRVYVAVAAFSPTFTGAGVYRFPAGGGRATFFAGAPSLTSPNGLIFDPAGNLYVSDSGAGVVFKVSPDGHTVTRWAQGPLLVGDKTSPCAATSSPAPVGANGLAIVGGNMFVANSEKGTIVKVPMRSDGTAGTLAVFSRSDASCRPLFQPDGIAADTDGSLLVALNAGNAIARVRADGAATTLVTGGQLDSPASVVVGQLHGKRYAFITNFAAASALTPGATPRPGLLAYGPLDP